MNENVYCYGYHSRAKHPVWSFQIFDEFKVSMFMKWKIHILI